MVRECLIAIYLFFFSFLFRLFKRFPQREKIVFVVTFIENSSYIHDELKKQDPSCQTIFLASNRVYSFFVKYDDSVVLKFHPKHVKDFILSIYHLATSKVVIVDNYYGFLSAITFRDNTTVLQIWHASGAIKQFGLMDPSTKRRSQRAKDRFQKVYDQFDQIIVGSEAMSIIFQQAFGLPESRMLRSGMPKTDVFFDKEAIEIIRKQMMLKFPYLEGKKIILYAPTYRDNELNHFHLALDLKEMKKALAEEYIVLLRLHPAIKYELDLSSFAGFVYDFSHYKKLNDLLFITDILITDYSSIPFDFSLLKKPMIFFPYDLEEYETARGFWEPYEKMVPGPIAYTTKEIIEIIQGENFCLNEAAHFRMKWNEYSNGHSSEKVASWILESLSEKKMTIEKVRHYG